jgi:hypothetical protein
LLVLLAGLPQHAAGGLLHQDVARSAAQILTDDVRGGEVDQVPVIDPVVPAQGTGRTVPLVVLQELLFSAVARILVVDSDPRWAGIAAALMAELRAALPGGCEQMEHIGSTSVPGLPAKPVIDLMASTADLDGVIGVEQ